MHWELEKAALLAQLGVVAIAVPIALVSDTTQILAQSESQNGHPLVSVRGRFDKAEQT